ncbi:MAG: phosphoenolpyruvate--protein phosphotransferase [Phycisphaeraceae bacterium]|nr:phosphoenolpyruvate--protein phosphotransferase [Phycisphaeraceae bacterium]
MSTTLKFACDLKHGLHARPASLIAQIAEKAKSRVLVKKSGVAEADARSVLSVIALDIQPGDVWEISIDGADATTVSSEIDSLVRSHFGEKAGEDGEFIEAPARVPAALQRMGVQVVSGRPASPGIGRGAVVRVRSRSLEQSLADRAVEKPEDESRRFRRAIETAADEVERRLRRASGTSAELLAAHRLMLNDSELNAAVEQRIADGTGAERAVAQATEEFADRLKAANSTIIRERAADVHDLAIQILSAMGTEIGDEVPTLTEPSVVIADSLTPGQLLRFDASKLAGLVLGEVGLTSHVVILARSMGLPAIVGAPKQFLRAMAAQRMLVDGAFGFAVADPDERVLRLYGLDELAKSRRAEFLASFGTMGGKTRDGKSLEIGANASSAQDVGRAVAGGADGIGLFRTEFLYLGRTKAPTEAELFETFFGAARAAGGRPIVFRTFDIGADKPAPFLHLPFEENPFLGARGARLYRRHATLLRTQLRAIVRSSEVAPGTVRIMAPMITTVEEMKWFQAQVRAVEKNLANGGFTAPPLQVGMMIETPAVAASVASFAPHADFFSLGTNDLSQYWFAADRGNGEVAPLANELEPSFVRMLQRAVSDAHVAGKWIGICGEMASRTANLAILLALGLDEISVSGVSGAEMKHRLAGLSSDECKSALDAVLSNPHTQGGEWAGTLGAMGSHVSPIAVELIQLECAASTKEEAIREMVGILYSGGRTDRPGDLEEDVWAREAVYSTGLGFGFAVPHCRTKAVGSVSVAVGRLARPIEWGSNDGLPVRHVMMLAVPDGADAKAHLQVLAKLARKLVHEEFRGAVERVSDVRGMAELLKRELGL